MQRCANHHDLHSRSESWRPGREKSGGLPLRKELLYIIRKPYKTQNKSQDSPQPLIAGYLYDFPQSVLSKSKIQKRVYLKPYNQ